MHLPGVLLEDARAQLADINHRHCQNKQWKRAGRLGAQSRR